MGGADMGRRRRHQDPDTFYLITNRTLGGMFLLLPDDEAIDIMVNCLAKFVEKHDVQLVAAIFLSNHFHLIARFLEANMHEFMRDLQREIARRINKLRDGRSRPVFPRRFDAKALIDGRALAKAISYVVNNPVRHQLVSHYDIWPGLVVGPDVLDGEREITGRWLDSELWYNLKRRQADHDRSEATEEIPLKTHLPEELPGDDWEERLCLLRARINQDRQYFLMQRRRGTRFPGPQKVLASNWSDTRPDPDSDSESTKFGLRRRRCSATSVRDFADYQLKLRKLETRYEDAAHRWRSGESAKFPTGMIPPGQTECVLEQKSVPPPG